MSITLAHPAPASFVQQVGRALYEADLLHEFATTIVYHPDRLQKLTQLATVFHIDLARQLSRRSITEFPIELVKDYPWCELTRLIVGRIDRDQRTVDRVFHWALHAYDRWVADHALTHVKAVYGYETACRATFRSAKQKGIACIYDVPSPEHDFVENLLYEEQQQYPELHTSYRQYCRDRQAQRTQHRREEWQLADVVIANSAFTRSTYAAAGLDVSNVKVVPLGAPPVNPDALKQQSSPHDAVQFLWAGTFSVRKGAHYLLQAWRQIKPRSSATLRIFGSIALPQILLQAIPEGIEFAGSVPHVELPKQYQRADALVFPTLCDGFGMVVTEAFAQGLPVITTDRAGASDLVKHGVNGLIVPAGDAQALAEALEWCITHRVELQAMRQAALETAASWQWSDYRRLLIESVTDGLTRAGAMP